MGATSQPAGYGIPSTSVQGMTLTEVVLVLAILGILAAVVGPRFVGVSGFKSSLFFDDVRVALRYAQKLAVATGCNVQVTITASSYTLNQQPSCSGASYTQAVTNPGNGSATYSGSAPAGTTVTSTLNPFRFDALGRATNTSGNVSNVTVTVSGRSLLVVGESGFVYAP